MKRILPFLLTLLLWAAPAAVKGQLTYTTNGDAITITGYVGANPVGLLSIPATTNGLPVTDIAPLAFAYATNLTSVTIPGSVANIESNAFEECTSLTNLAITDGVAIIGQEAFFGCGSLARLIIPASVTYIGAYAFDECSNMASATISNGAANLGGGVFEFCTSLASVTLPGGLTNIGGAAAVLYGCTHLTSVTISDGSTSVVTDDFAFFTNLTSVTIPASVVDIKDYAFQSCSNLTQLTIAQGVASIGNGSFAFCTSLPSVVLPNSVTSIAELAFEECPDLTNATIGNSATNIGSYAFAFCGSLRRITIPASVASIGSNAFAECTGLTALTIENGLTDIGTAAFAFCTNLASATLLGSVANLESNAFEECTSLNSFTVLGSVSSIGPTAFLACSNLVGVAFYGGVGEIGYAVFAYCPKLTSVLFGGDAPSLSTNGPTVFYSDRTARVYHNSGTSGWSSSFAELPDATLTQPSGLLSVFINGHGSTSPKDNGAVLTLGKSYTITAAPAGQDYIFLNWTGGTNASSPTLLSTKASFKFLMESNLTLTANFVTNLFLAAQGTYTGLFEVTNEAARQQTNSGSFTLKVTGGGSLTGGLSLGSPTAFSFSGKIGPNGVATNIIKRHGASTLTNVLTLDVSHQSVQGTITDGSFVAQLKGNLSVFSSKNKAPYAGQYTVIIAGTNTATNGPFGTSYGTITVTPAGVITFAGTLADGTSFSQSSFVSQDGAWPCYLPLYGGNGSFFSWNYFTNKATNGLITLASAASWINAGNPSATAAYKVGFTNAAAVISALPYSPNLLTLPDGMGQVVLEGGGLDLGPSITNNISLSSNDQITFTSNANKMVLTINKASGLISGTFANDSKTIKVGGAWFQSEGDAQGYFLGTDQTSGTFTLETTQ